MVIRINIIILIAAIAMVDFSIAMVWYRKRFRALPMGIIVNLVAGFELLSELMYAMGDEVPLVVTRWMNVHMVFHYVLSIALIAHSIGTVLIENQIRRSTISLASIQKAINEMDQGLMFAFSSGAVVLINKRMEMLSRTLFNQYPKDCSRFFSKLLEFEDTEEIKKVDFTGWPAFRFPDGEIWTFEREMIKDKSTTYVEIVAKNITTLYNRGLSLEEENNKLKNLQLELNKVLRSISETRNAEELLHYKMRIHDQLGNAILRTRTCLRDDNLSQQYVEEILYVWENTIKAFEENLMEAKPAEESSLQEVIKQAEAFGIDFTITGKFPAENALAVRAVREAMYNSIRHAYANEIHVESYKAFDGYHIKISDDGVVTTEKITEGGGLTSLRNSLEEIGGSLAVSIKKGVVLNVFVPNTVS